MLVNRKVELAVGAVAVVMLAYAGYAVYQKKAVPSAVNAPVAAPEGSQSGNSKHVITLTTNFGEIQFETYDADAPKAVENFVSLARKGFYNGLTFHRVIKGFMVQGGDPKGDGTGGPGYTFPDELNPASESGRQGYKKGVVAMANAGPNTNGSQFFIMLEDTALPYQYTIFGKVTKGQEIVDVIGNVATDRTDRPVSPVRIEKATVAELP